MTIPKTLLRDFRKLLGEDSVLSEEADLLSYAFDSAVVGQSVPSVVLAPATEGLLGRTVKACYDAGLQITARGAGTNLSGAAVPGAGPSAVILTNRLNRILEVNEADLYAVVEPGVVTADFAKAMEAKGLFYPPDPGSQQVSTLGGNVALNAGGLRGLKYGVTKDYLMGVEFFDWGGELVKSGSRTVKWVTGYNLPGLMLASEGTLGIFSKLILKLVPPPKASVAMLASYPSVGAASQTVAAIIAAHVLPSTLEFLDRKCLQVVEANARIGLPTDAGAILLIETDGGHAEGVKEEAELVRSICLKNGAGSVRVAKDAAERDALWAARRNTLPSLARLRPTTVLEDATVPRSKVPEMVAAVERLAKEHGLEVGTFGHAGDGNLHPTILCDRRDREGFKKVEAMVDGIFTEALALGGTLSGEHGIGIAKAKWLSREENAATIGLSKAIRKALDPRQLFNPGKKVV
ncbi:MAG: FAD-binding protein [Deltaproteobacteria bacterium]|jgi:glycolate oxidase|nr:FAD-binding protein [Deltaproteobacteria bacterium]